MTSLLLTLVMLLSLLPAMGATASAADDIENWSRFKSYLESTTSRDLTLENDIDYTTGYDDDAILITKSQKLDLNGHKIRIDASKRAEFYNLITIRSGEFTLCDSKGGGAIEVEFARDSKGHCIIMISPDSAGAPAKFTMNGGTLTRLNPMNSGAYGNNGCISDNYFVKFKGGERPQITINGGTINCAYDWNNRERNAISGVQYMPTALLLRYSQLTVNGGTFNGIVWTDELLWREGDAEPRVLLNGGVFNFPFAVTGLLKNKTQMVIDGARFNDGLYVAKGIKLRSYEGNEPAMLIKSGVFDASGQNLKLDIRSVTADGWYTAQGKQQAIKYAMKLFPNSAIKLNGKIYTSENISSRVIKDGTEGYYLNLNLKGPIEVIRDAWGMKSVTLDGNPIDYFKDWNGTVERMDNSTAHTLKFEWYPLAQDLKDAGYTYRANFDCYTVGSNTPTTSVPISATATEYSHTIHAGEAPSVYPFDLQLNLKKGDDTVGIYTNDHIVKLVVNEAPVVTEIYSAPVRLSAALTPDGTAPSATAVGSGYTVDSIKWYTNNECTTEASTFAAGIDYYGKIVLKPAENYKFAASASALLFCDDPNENYAGISSTVAEDGSSLTRVVKGKAVTALKWDSVDKTNQTYTIGDNALTLNAKAVGGDSDKPISYKLIAKKDGTETVKASAMVAASLTDSFSAPLSFTDTGSYECWFEATRGNVTITSDHFTVTVNAPGLSITNQSGDLTVKQNATARLFVKAVGHGVKYEWQVKNDGTWNAISGETAYDYAAPTTDAGEKTYRCVVTDKYGATKYTNKMTVTVTEVADSSLTPAIPLAAVNGDAPDPAVLWPDKDVPPSIWLSRTSQYNVTAGETFHGVATFSTIPTGFNMNSHDIYSIAGVQKTPVLGDISYEWKAAATEPWLAAGGAIAVLSTEKSANITIPSGVTTYYAQLKVMNTVGTDTQTSTVEITFHVSEAHTHTYAYAQLNESNHTKYCTACDESTTEAHTMDNGVCTLCGYAPAKTYKVTVTNGTATPDADVAPGTKVTLTANAAPSGQEFDKWVGNVAVASDNTFNMPSHDVTVAATYKPIAHTHNTDSQDWVYMDPGTHIQTCTAGDDFKVEAHDFSAWTKVDDTNHSRTCSKCKKSGETANYTETAEHTWVWVVDQEAALNQPGKQHEECTGCHAERSENTVIPALQDYAVAVTGGTATVAAGTITRAMEGVEVTVTAQAPAGKHFVKWVVKAGGVTLANETSATTTFIMPATDVAIEANFEKNASTGGGGGGGVTTYPITVKSAKNGDVTVSPRNASKGTTVTITVEPDKGYTLETITVTDKNGDEIALTNKGDGKYTFKMPAGKVYVEATFMEDNSMLNFFVDVPADAYYYDAVLWAAKNGITGGVDDTHFAPNATCTRAQVVTFLWRAAGSPAPKSSMIPFTDVPAGSYYEQAVLWAVENGITDGTSATTFSPDAVCSRGQIVTFLWRANGSPAVSGNSAFTDVASDAYYAAAVTWAEKNDITGGIGGGLFGSNNNCTRAQIVTFIYRSVK